MSDPQGQRFNVYLKVFRMEERAVGAVLVLPDQTIVVTPLPPRANQSFTSQFAGDVVVRGEDTSKKARLLLVVNDMQFTCVLHEEGDTRILVGYLLHDCWYSAYWDEVAAL